jgi:hypothetical protein
VLEANGSAAKDANFATAKTTTTSMDSANLDIFSQAMASAEIGDYSAAENISSKCPKGSFTNYVYKRKGVESPKMTTGVKERGHTLITLA